MDREPIAIHPPGFKVSDHRKAIPIATKFEAVMGQNGRCSKCGERLGTWADTQFDHRPALMARPWCEATQDFIPPQLDPNYIDADHKKCHDVATNGPGGERRITTRGSDKGEGARVRSLSRSQEEFRARLLAKSTGEEPPAPKRRKAKIPNAKKQWPSRPFSKTPKARRKSA